MAFSTTASCHVWNLFYKESLSDDNSINNNEANSVIWIADSSIIDLPPTAPTLFGTEDNSSVIVTSLDISWNDTKTIEDRGGNLLSVLIFQDGSISANTPNISWEVYNSITGWVSDSTPVTAINTFLLDDGINRFRLKFVNSNNSIVYSNVLEYNVLVPIVKFIQMVSGDHNSSISVGTPSGAVSDSNANIIQITGSVNQYIYMSSYLSGQTGGGGGTFDIVPDSSTGTAGSIVSGTLPLSVTGTRGFTINSPAVLVTPGRYKVTMGASISSVSNSPYPGSTYTPSSGSTTRYYTSPNNTPTSWVEVIYP